MKKKLKKEKAKIEKKKLFEEQDKDYTTLENSEYIEKYITEDGNCFYRVLSYYYRYKEDDFDEFRQLIVNYIKNNIEDYLIFIPEKDLNLPANIEYSIEFIQQKKIEYLINILKLKKIIKNGLVIWK